jgi:iron complex transport system substrate-binding protein
MKKRILFPLAVFLLSCSFSYSFELKDDLGNTWQFDSTPQRIISLAPSITESLFAIGAASQLVGVTEYSDYPEEAKKLPRVGGLNLQYEVIVALHPDVLIGDPALTSKSLEKLKSLNLKVVAIRTQNLSDIHASLMKLGKISGHEEQARIAGDELQEKIKRISAATSGLPKPRVFLEIWDKPLMTAGPRTFLGELIELAGGTNIVKEMAQDWGQVSEEFVIQSDPEIVLLLTTRKEDLLKQPAWKETTAARTGQVYELDRALFSQPSPRIVEALQQLVSLIHPTSQIR